MSDYPAPPPPGGGYGAPPPPPGGGYGAPPPQGGGYGSPPPQGGGYGGYGGPASGPWDLGAALSYGWAKFQANVGQILLAALVLVVSIVVVYAVLLAVLVSAADNFVLSLVLLGLTLGIVLVVGQVVGAGLIRACLDVTEGRPFRVSRVLAVENIGHVLVTALIIGAATGVGYMLCYLPGLAVMFLTSYAMYFVVDQGLAPVEAIKASYELVTKNFSTAIIWYVVGGLVASAGAIACGVGVLVTIPLVLIGTAFTYKKLTGQAVAP